MIIIKPHHFMDIIKLYGKGIEKFVPDEDFGHDFYKVANSIIEQRGTGIMITFGCDDICEPCRYMKNGLCSDCLHNIENFNSKDEYNKILDKRIMHFINKNEKCVFAARDFCRLLYDNKEIIYRVWREENKEDTDNRYKYFCAGAEKYLNCKTK